MEHEVSINNNNNQDELEAFISVQRKALKAEGRKLYGISSECSPKIVPAWFEPEVFRRAQKLYSRYTPIIHMNAFYGLILVAFSIDEGLMPQLVTGNSRTVSKLYIRYLSTLIHIHNWFRHYPFDHNSKSYRSLKTVRGYHHQLASRMNQLDKNKSNGDGSVWMSQFAMSSAQFTFMGFMTVFPNELGFSTFSKKDFHAMFHFWRVIGYCLGIEDKFNLCSGTNEEIFERCRQFYWVDMLPIIPGQEKTGIELAKGICLAMSRFTQMVNYNAMLRYGSTFMGFDEKLFPLSGLFDYASYYSLILIYRHTSKYKMLTAVMSSTFKLYLWTAIKLRKFNMWYLRKKYDGEISFDSDQRCPYEIKFNYQNAVDLDLY